MEIADENLVECLVFLNCFLDGLDRLVVPFDIEMIAHGFALRRKAMQDQTFRFPEGQAIALYGIGVIIRLDPELLRYAGKGIGTQRAQCVQLLFQSIDFFDGVAHNPFLQ